VIKSKLSNDTSKMYCKLLVTKFDKKKKSIKCVRLKMKRNRIVQMYIYVTCKHSFCLGSNSYVSTISDIWSYWYNLNSCHFISITYYIFVINLLSLLLLLFHDIQYLTVEDFSSGKILYDNIHDKLVIWYILFTREKWHIGR